MTGWLKYANWQDTAHRLHDRDKGKEEEKGNHARMLAVTIENSNVSVRYLLRIISN